jgi:hypothetical protein
MTDAMIVSVPPYEGEYEFDIEGHPFSTVEWRWIKQIAGYMPLTIEQGWQGGDPDLFLAFAVIAMRRSGKITKAEVLEVAGEIEEAAMDGASISFRGGSSEEAEVDPPLPGLPGDSSSDSGESSSEPSEDSQESETPEPSGTPDSVTGATLRSVTSRT